MKLFFSLYFCLTTEKKIREHASHQEYLKLKARVEALQRSQRNLLGEDLGPLSGKELEFLEKQLDSSLKQIRSTRTQYMLDQLTDLQRREQMLSDANKTLRRRLEEGAQASQQQWDMQHGVGYSRQQQSGHHQAADHNQGFFHPLECEPTLQIGYQQDQITVAQGAPMGSYMPGWLA
ncbi:hypothetical protein MKW94_017116 [Papaver nudicaule]|uniref:K-box domain-containing protein n=1 Tax=Papaver nudicaule TaxID=74823 RepID=A0AA41UWV7_PAPNU|nr:hypothetical protein [Papaver nudicaule]